MRTSELSDAGALGFRAGPDDQRKLFSFSPVTAAVAATAFLSAALFIAYDTARTYDEIRRNLTTIGAAIASDIITRSPELTESALNDSVGRFGNVTRASLVGDNMPVPGPLMHIEPVGSHGAIAIETAHDEALSGIAGRGGAALALAGLFTLAASRRRQEKPGTDQHRDSSEQLAAAIPLGLACWTSAGQLIFCNDQYRTRLGVAHNTLTYHQAVSRLISGGRMKLVGEDENSRLLELSRQDGSCLRIDERPLGDGAFMTLVSDVTERKRTDALLSAVREEQRLLARRYHEEKLKAEAASRAKTNFLAHLSHDIRTPLNHIIGFAELMQHETYGPLGDARYTEYVQSIQTSGEHLLASFAAILDLTELESGQKALRHDPVLLDEVLDTVVKRFHGQIKRGGIALKLGVPTGAVLRGDRLGFIRMVGNIMDNAVRFTRAGGQITLAAYCADDGVVVEISDTGIGMDDERLAGLSQPFALGDATFTRDGVGPGLGISIARAIAELSGGHIAIDSRQSLGTTVAITLPLEMAAAELAA